MATTPLTPITSAFNLTTDWQTLYTVTGNIKRIGIDAAVFNNYSTNKIEFSVRLVQSGTATDLNEIITDKNIRAGGNDLSPAMIGQSVILGGKIQAKVSANGAVNVNITATIVT